MNKTSLSLSFYTFGFPFSSQNDFVHFEQFHLKSRSNARLFGFFQLGKISFCFIIYDPDVFHFSQDVSFSLLLSLSLLLNHRLCIHALSLFVSALFWILFCREWRVLQLLSWFKSDLIDFPPPFPLFIHNISSVNHHFCSVLTWTCFERFLVPGRLFSLWFFGCGRFRCTCFFAFFPSIYNCRQLDNCLPIAFQLILKCNRPISSPNNDYRLLTFPNALTVLTTKVN